MAIPKKYRLATKKKVDVVYRQGASIKRAPFFVKYLANPSDHAQVAILVPKSVSRSAVERHKVKRRLAEALVVNKILTKNLDLVVVALPPILKKDFLEIKAELDKATKEILV